MENKGFLQLFCEDVHDNFGLGSIERNRYIRDFFVVDSDSSLSVSFSLITFLKNMIFLQWIESNAPKIPITITLNLVYYFYQKS